MFDELSIVSPKRNKRLQTGWEGFFPYYAGFPELFANEILKSAGLAEGAKILDPWNGSGTTTYAADRLGFSSVGLDLNPVMVIVARARLLAPSEADHLRPLAATILSQARAAQGTLDPEDRLLAWLAPETARFVRAIEKNIRRSLVGSLTKSADGIHLDRISGTAATLYVALFGMCRRLVAPYRSSNPTWLRCPKPQEQKVAVSMASIASWFAANVRGMTRALVALQETADGGESFSKSCTSILRANTTSVSLDPESVDFVLTSPPYCTRIDYTAATRVELAVLAPLLATDAKSLGQQMIGSTQVPGHTIAVSEEWGETCGKFLEALRSHHSKASSGYYYRTHLDYFDKMSCSLARVSKALKPGGSAVLVVQDSYYKNLHNDLPVMMAEMAANHGLTLGRRDDFHLRSMSDVHPGRKTYDRPKGANESVLCFSKH
ncbi:DNA methyltransferase [Roseovarius sp. C03]|uniref:DNA methyltransferase n=1 Tax=Roseovarius sp. C03 TaxID=3449222 RepID=UPI003EDBDEEC